MPYVYAKILIGENVFALADNKPAERPIAVADGELAAARVVGGSPLLDPQIRRRAFAIGARMEPISGLPGRATLISKQDCFTRLPAR